MALAGIVARYWTRETVTQIIQTVALMWLFLLAMDLTGSGDGVIETPPPGPRAACADLIRAIRCRRLLTGTDYAIARAAHGMIVYPQVGRSMQDGPRILVAAALGKIIEPILRQSLTDARVRIAEDKGAVLRAIGDRLRFDVVVTDLTWMDYAVEYSFDGLDVLKPSGRRAGRRR